MADPISAQYEAQIAGLQADLAALPGIYNPQRQRLAYEAGRGLEESGLYDAANVQQNPAAATGDATWVVFRGPQGRLFRQMFTSASAGANTAGALFSSTAERAKRQGQNQLNTQGDVAIRNFETGQTGLTEKELADTRSMSSSLSTTRGTYADWKAAQTALADPVPLPPTPPADPIAAVADTTPAPGSAAAAVSKLKLGAPSWSPANPYGPAKIPVKGYAAPLPKKAKR